MQHPWSYWPPNVQKAQTVDAYVAAFATMGYAPTTNGDPEAGLEKVAIFVDNAGEPTHMARQLPSGSWTSKLGDLEDIDHQDIHALEGGLYGTVVAFLARPRRG
jgi:hypothetical protein